MDYFTADLHLHHPKLAELRGFASVADHDTTVLANLSRLNPETDTLWVLGDICSGGVASMESALAQLSTLALPMHLVTGNHDPVHPMYRNAQRHFPAYTAVFRSVQQSARKKVGDTGVLLSHFPYAGTPDRLTAVSLISISYLTWGCGCCTDTPIPRSAVRTTARSVCRWKRGT